MCYILYLLLVTTTPAICVDQIAGVFAYQKFFILFIMILKIFGASKYPVLNVLFTLVCAFSGNTKADLFDQ